MPKKPKLFIQYSFIYDQTIHDLRKESFDEKERIKLADYVARFSKHWDKYNDKVFKLISEISGLKWKRTEIDAYVLNKIRPFSNPLTLNVKDDFDVQTETVIHELCHNILVQNNSGELVRKLREEFKEDMVIIRHLPVYAIEIPILRKLFDSAKVDELLALVKNFKTGLLYWKAIQIVLKKKPDYFLKMLADKA